MLSIPLLRQIKRKWPEQSLVLVCRPGLGEFFLRNNLVDEVFELDKKSNLSCQQFINFFSDKKINYLFCPHQSIRSAWILKQLTANKKISYRRWWNKPFFDILVERIHELPEALRVLHLLAAVDVEMRTRLDKIHADKKYLNSNIRMTIEKWPHAIASDLSLFVEPEPELVQEVLKKLNLQKPYAVIAPASQWATKRWTKTGFAKLSHLLSERALNVYIVGTKAEADYCLEVERLSADYGARVDIRSLAGRTSLLELHAVLSHAEVVIANDSGPMHMATAAGRPVVAIFGPTTLDLGFRPWSELSYISQKDLACRPCGKHGHNVCPIKTHECMKSITANDIVIGVDLLRKKAPAAGSLSSSQIY